MARGIYVPAEASEPLEERQFVGLEDYQRAVDGWIEAVDVPDLGVTIYINEEGLLRHLDFNSRATFLWWHYVPEARQQAMLVGNAVIVGMPDKNGDSTDVPEAAFRLLMQHARYAVVLQLEDGSLLGMKHAYDDFFEAIMWASVIEQRRDDVESTLIIAWDELPSEARDAIEAKREVEP
ncbi:DUF3846 domain-containing protein [Flaviflexus salsibiostraticola]|uniref:DUF3846 domain-containing protein n=1 Tax=Flaviflexus salsibiostraticola TaxID=1282737 RepID=A0A3Q8WSS9_9ACTO|nr:DUF3846 domain-containing protein [Flaviflexus salsibiostraticola]AZN29358.1 DUF3846 domain-containing protein [Flaviflexus salsibiostraticola]